MPIWSQRRDSNPRPTDYKSVALPAELRWLICWPKIFFSASKEQGLLPEFKKNIKSDIHCCKGFIYSCDDILCYIFIYSAIFCFFLLFSLKFTYPAKKQKKNFNIFSICATCAARFVLQNSTRKGTEITKKNSVPQFNPGKIRFSEYTENFG